MLVELDPPVDLSRLGASARMARIAIIAPRFEGEAIDRILEWPAHVHVAFMRDNSSIDRGVFVLEDVETSGWGELHWTSASDVERSTDQGAGKGRARGLGASGEF